MSDIEDVLTKEDEQKIKDELNHPNFKKWFRGLLHVTTADVVFTKLNGEERTMRCTLQESAIPAEKQPKGTTKKEPEDAIAVFDIEKREWRSFRFDSIKEFGWEFDEGVEYPSTPEAVFFDENGNEIVEEEDNENA